MVNIIPHKPKRWRELFNFKIVWLDLYIGSAKLSLYVSILKIKRCMALYLTYKYKIFCSWQVKTEMIFFLLTTGYA